MRSPPDAERRPAWEPGDATDSLDTTQDGDQGTSGTPTPAGIEVRLALFERLVEQTEPAPADYRCTCNRCTYGPRYIGREHRNDAA